MYDGSETIDRVGFTDQTISRVLLSSPQLCEGRSTHLSTHDEAGVCIVVRSGTFGCSRVVSVPKGVTNTSLCDQSNSLLASLANFEVETTTAGVGDLTVIVPQAATLVR